MASITPVDNVQVAFDSFVQRVEELITRCIAEIDERHFTIKDAADIVRHVHDILTADIETVKHLTVQQQKTLLQRLVKHVVNRLTPLVDETVGAVLQTAVLFSDSLFDAIRNFVLDNFDLNKDGKVSREECAQVCGSCCMPSSSTKHR